ncbi:MAG: EFR1 family ferrodoxin, partial [Bacteroidales bacterium]
MIFYFSGTGNSKWIAQTMALAMNEQLISLAEYMIDEFFLPVFTLKPEEKIGFVFPVHSWGIPPIVVKFIQKLSLSNWMGQTFFAVATCGDECGLTSQMFQSLIEKKGWRICHFYSVVMPNNYISLPGFDVDDKKTENTKLENAVLQLPMIIEAIEKDEPFEFYSKGHFSFLKSKLVYPMFCRYALSDRSFVQNDSCIACGLCVRRCPTHNISLKNETLVWHGHCTQCLACLHSCPTKA